MDRADPRYSLRLRQIEREKSAGVFARAFLQVKKRLLRMRYVTQPLDIPEGLRRSSPSVFVVTVAFNQPELIALQLKALETFVKEPYHYLVVDNSPDESASRAIREIVEASSGSYLKAPRNPFSWRDPSLSHSVVLDWLWRGLVRRLRPGTLVVLDHDVFPRSPVSLELLGKETVAAGYRRQSIGSEHWLLWPGLLFLNVREISRFRVSFMPRADTDSGGSLYWSVYRRVSPERIRFLPRRDLVFDPRAPRFGDGSSGEIHLFDQKWVHLIDGSGWSDGIAKLSKLPDPGATADLDALVRAIEVLERKR